MDNLQFARDSFLGFLDNRWVLVNAEINGQSQLVIQAGGSARLVLTSEVQDECKFMRIDVEFSCTAVSSANNYKSNPTLLIKEVCKDINDNTINKAIFRAFGFNTFTPTSRGYSDSSIYQTTNQPMASLSIIITNQTTDQLVIYGIGAYRSIDVSEAYVRKVTQSVSKGDSATSFKVYHNDDEVGSLNGLGWLVQGSTLEIKLQPTYFQGQLIAINTNYGQAISIQHVIEQIDLLI